MTKHAFKFEGDSYTFNIDNPDDAIQKEHLRGNLFDYAELVEMSKLITDGDTIIDIGANVGNHTVYFSKKYTNSKIIPFEPHPEALSILRKNIADNSCVNVESRYLGIGLSDTNGSDHMIRGGKNNLGNSRLICTDSIAEETLKSNVNYCEIEIAQGDNILLNENPDFIKIDVEGHELNVLNGLEQTIECHRPGLFLEVNKANDIIFKEWVLKNGYSIQWIDAHYQTATNYLLSPV